MTFCALGNVLRHVNKESEGLERIPDTCAVEQRSEPLNHVAGSIVRNRSGTLSLSLATPSLSLVTHSSTPLIGGLIPLMVYHHWHVPPAVPVLHGLEAPGPTHPIRHGPEQRYPAPGCRCAVVFGVPLHYLAWTITEGSHGSRVAWGLLDDVRMWGMVIW